MSPNEAFWDIFSEPGSTKGNSHKEERDNKNIKKNVKTISMMNSPLQPDETILSISKMVCK